MVFHAPKIVYLQHQNQHLMKQIHHHTLYVHYIIVSKKPTKSSKILYNTQKFQDTFLSVCNLLCKVQSIKNRVWTFSKTPLHTKFFQTNQNNTIAQNTSYQKIEVYSIKDTKRSIAKYKAKEKEAARKRWQQDAKKQGFLTTPIPAQREQDNKANSQLAKDRLDDLFFIDTIRDRQ